MTETSLFLRESTAEAHRHAETRPLNRALARGEISRTAWLTSLEQHLLLYQALERRLDQLLITHPAWAAAFAEPFRRRVPDFKADILDQGGSLASAPLPATASALQAIEQASPEAIAGMLYVSEGSTNGGRFLAKGAARALGVDLASRTGFRNLDPYGDLQPAKWGSFKTGIDSIAFSDIERNEIRLGADAMFIWVGDLADQIWSLTETAASG